MEKITTQKVKLQVADGTTIDAYTARPERKGKIPGMLVFQEAFGVNAHIRDVTERMAQEGYVAIAPELYHRTAPGFEAGYTDFQAVVPHYQAMTEDGARDDIRAAHEWLGNDPEVEPESIGSIGFCLGGRTSFLACATVPLRAAISFYGGGIAPNLLPQAGNLAAPVLFFWGGLDQHIGAEQINSVLNEMKRVKKPYVNVEFSDADHGFFCDARPSYNGTAAGLAWTLARQFLETHLKDSSQRAHIG